MFNYLTASDVMHELACKVKNCFLVYKFIGVQYMVSEFGLVQMFEREPQDLFTTCDVAAGLLI